ncbi:MAG: Do family serine endopeptidase [Thermoanaerobaculaceae bacterium]
MKKKSKILMLALTTAATFGFVAGMVLSGGSNLSKESQAQAPQSTAASPRTFPDFAELAERVMPSVLTVTTEDVISERDWRRLHPDMDPFEFFFGPRRLPRQRAFGAGSAFFIAADGLALTNNHVVERADKIFAYTANRDRYQAKVIGRDPATDLALIKVEGKGPFPFLPLGDSDALRVGEWVMAVGNPFGIGQTVTVGVVSGKGRTLNLSRESFSFENFIQTDAAINRGNSGGPLVNLKGEVVAINSAMNAGAENMGFAVPVNTAKAILPQLKEKGKVVRGFLGVTITNISAEDQETFGLPSRDGALVQDVMEKGPAAKAGIKHGDVIVAVNGKPITSQRELIDTISLIAPGTKVELGIIRDGKRKNVTVTLAERKAESEETDEESAEESQEGADKLGLDLADLSPRWRRQLNLPDGVFGVVVRNVEELSPAEDAGLAPGDVILEINGKPVESLAEFNEELAKIGSGRVIRLYIYREGGRRFVTMRMP